MESTGPHRAMVVRVEIDSGDTSPEVLKVAERAKDPEFVFLALAHLLDEAALRRAYRCLYADAAVGIDGITKEQYRQEILLSLTTSI